jgi:hypothetical protein
MSKHRFRELHNPDRPRATFGAACADCGEGIMHPDHDPDLDGDRASEILAHLTALAADLNRRECRPNGEPGASMGVSRTLDAIAELAGTLSARVAYCNAGEKFITKLANTRGRQIRRVLGYTYP